MIYFLDTSAIINLLKAKKDISDWFNKTEGEFVSGYVCMAELYEGVFRSEDSKKAEKQIVEFFQSLGRTIGVDGKTAREFGVVKAQLQKKGSVIDDVDIFIGAICKVEDLTVVTFNAKHFSRIEGLKVVGF